MMRGGGGEWERGKGRVWTRVSNLIACFAILGRERRWKWVAIMNFLGIRSQTMISKYENQRLLQLTEQKSRR